MAFSSEISRSNPTCFVFFLDQSGAMTDQFGGEYSQRKADSVADVVNRTLHDLVIRCTEDRANPQLLLHRGRWLRFLGRALSSTNPRLEDCTRRVLLRLEKSLPILALKAFERSARGCCGWIRQIYGGQRKQGNCVG
jgi:hypothetical protein